MDLNECDPEHPENCEETPEKISAEQREKELKLTKGGLSGFMGNAETPIDESLRENIDNQCRIQGGDYNPKEDSCKIGDTELPNFSKLVGREDYKRVFAKEIESGRIPNALFVGPFGSGKTSFADAITVEYAMKHNLNPEEFRYHNVITVSGRNGINFIRDNINRFLKVKGIAGNHKFILLDEADDLTQDAQRQLKTVFNEIQSKHLPITIILMSNYPGRILPDITQSGRFRTLEFGKVPDVEMKRILKEIAPNITANQQLIDFSNGNIRSLQENIERLNEGLSLRDYRLQNIEQLEKSISKKELELDVLRRQKLLDIRRQAESVASEYSNKDIVRSLYDLQNEPSTEENANTELILREALMYRGLSNTEIKNALKDYKQEQIKLQEQLKKQAEENAIPGYSQLGFVSSYRPGQSSTMTEQKFSGVVGKFYQQELDAMKNYFKAKYEGNDLEASKYDDIALDIVIAYQQKYPNFDNQIAEAQKQAIKDAQQDFLD